MLGPACCSTARRSGSPPGDRVGLVGRNGAGKTTLTKVLAGQGQPAAGTCHQQRRGGLPAAGPAHRRPARPGPRPHPVGPRARPDHHPDARGRGRDGQRRRRDAGQGDAPLRAARGRVHRRRAGMPPSPRPRRSPARLRSTSACSASRSAPSPAASAAASSCRGSCSPGPQTLLLDEPTNHLDADSIAWLRDYLKGYQGGLVVISHDVELLDAVVNRVFHLDANRGELDLYNVGWKPYLLQRETDERRRKREYANATKKASALHGAGREDARQGHQGRRRPEHDQARRADARRRRGGADQRQGRQAALPRAGAVRQARRCGPAGCRAPTAARRSSPTSTWPSTAARGSSCWASTAPARPPCCGCSPASTPPTPARSSRATG